jgi:hypothetical protein
LPRLPFSDFRNVLLSALLLFAGYALADPDPVAHDQITGTWISSEQTQEQGQVDTLMTIKVDGSFSGSLLVNNEINWEYTESSLVLLVEDRSEVDTILSLGQDEMVLKSGRWRSVRALRRVK